MKYGWPDFDDLLKDHTPLAGKRVLVRVDFNVPMHDGQPNHLGRLLAAVPTVEALVQQKACVILLSHLGNPKHVDVHYSLRPIAQAFSEILGKPVLFNETENLEPGAITLLENTRFSPGEKENDASYAQQLAQLGDIFIFDAFPVAHRKHASTCGIMAHLPTFFGLGFEKEWASLHEVTLNKPIVAVIGGAKISTKLKLLEHLLETMDGIMIGGGMANTFLAAQGYPTGHSLIEHNLLEEVRTIIAKAQERNCPLLLPQDVIVERAGGRCKSDVAHVEDSDVILDIGSNTLQAMTTFLESMRTIIWNGPLGAFETPGFEHGTYDFAKAVSQRTQAGKLYSLAGGGDTLFALEKAGVHENFSYISTAGGAFLAWLAGELLPVFHYNRERKE